MKRSWIGAGLLALLLAAAMIAGWTMDWAHSPVVAALEQAELGAMEGDWVSARQMSSRAEDMWHRWEGLRSGLSDHTPMEEIAGQFAQLRRFGTLESREDFCALAALTAQKVQTMGDAHGLDWGNFF